MTRLLALVASTTYRLAYRRVGLEYALFLAVEDPTIIVHIDARYPQWAR